MVTMLALPGAVSVGILADFVGDRIVLGTFGTVRMLLLNRMLAFGGRRLRAL